MGPGREYRHTMAELRPTLTSIRRGSDGYEERWLKVDGMDGGVGIEGACGEDEGV